MKGEIQKSCVSELSEYHCALHCSEDASNSGSETSETSPFMSRSSSESLVPSFNDAYGSLRIINTWYYIVLND